ncbi:MAG: FtsH-binding integral membrane protein [Polaribacter sp.]|jgi:FtsH-binding integral membrane protein|tara:strand:+ start:76 stop:276 length:201 start_codon:yes stop_codon:yes gene_type:complete
MNRIWKFFQYGYLIVALICLVEAVVRWSTERSKAYLFLGFAFIIILVFFFKRHFRKKVDKRNNQNK